MRFEMPIETEKKYRLDAARTSEISKRLEELGSIFSGEVFEENFLHRGGVLDERNAVLRLRRIGGVTLLTYKEKLPSRSGAKNNIEFETEIADVDAAENIIERLGYKLSVVYEKRRRTWHLHDVEVVLDELPFGLYMEIEGTIEAIEKAEKLLRIEDLESELRGYPSLTLKFGKLKNDVATARFKKRVSADKAR